MTRRLTALLVGLSGPVAGFAAAAAGVGLWGLGVPQAASLGVAVGALVLLQGALLLAVRNAVGQQQHEALASDLAMLRERLLLAESRLAETDRRAVESPAIVWRAAAADINVLGSLVRDLARGLAEHEAQLARLSPPEAPAEEPATGEPAAPELPPPETAEERAEGTAAGAAYAVSSLASRGVTLEEMAQTVRHALASDRLDFCLQPIVSLPQRRTRAYEASLRLKAADEEGAVGIELRRLAVAARMEFDFDMKLVQRALQALRVMRAREQDGSIICRAAPMTLASARFAPAFRELLQGDRELAQRLLLEMTQREWRQLGPVDAELVQTIPELGPALALAPLDDLAVDAAELASAGIRLVRAPAALLVAGLEQAAGVEALALRLARLGVSLVASDVAAEQEVLDLLDIDVPLAQGPLLGAARPVKPEVLDWRPVPPDAANDAAPTPSPQAPAVPKAPPAPAEAAAPQAPPQRVSYRSLLRRANG